MGKLFLKLIVGVFSLTMLMTSSAVYAAKPAATPLGNDISWPQCGKALPKGQAFGIVGVNGGKATNTNPCLKDQLLWAQGSSGAVAAQPPVQLYVNTANPGEVLEQYNVTTWPTDNIDPSGKNTNSTGTDAAAVQNPFGACTGNWNNDLACSWQYGWNRAVESVIDRFVPAAQSAGMDANASSYIWWLDVETMNSWQAETMTTESPERDAALRRNVATLEAMTAYYESLNAEVGIYSTNYQWGRIVGSQVGSDSILTQAGRKSWLAGARDLKDAKARCTSTHADYRPLTAGGVVVMHQYIARSVDYNYSCI